MTHQNIKITSADYIGPHSLKLTFQDGKISSVNFYDFLNSSTNPMIKNFLDLEKFKTFKILNGDLMWGDYELIFPIQDLYDGHIS
jgi:hypothetical protein